MWLDCETQKMDAAWIKNCEGVKMSNLPCVEDNEDPKTMQLLKDWV